MRLEHFANELPDRETLKNMNRSAVDAIVEILEMGVHADGAISRQELDTLSRELELLPTNATIESVGLVTTEESFFNEPPAAYQHHGEDSLERLERLAASIDSDLEKQACMRLLAILCCGDGLDTAEIEFYRHVVNALDYDFDTAEDLLRAANASRQAALPQIAPA